MGAAFRGKADRSLFEPHDQEDSESGAQPLRVGQGRLQLAGGKSAEGTAAHRTNGVDSNGRRSNETVAND